jgi:hypothetical protein
MKIPGIRRVAVAAAVAAALASSSAPVVLGSSSAMAQDGADASAILKAMSDYVSSQKSISATFNSDIEVITPELQKIQFTSTGQIQMTRPDKIHLSRTGGYASVELFYDGKTVTLSDRKSNVFAQAEVPGTVEQLIEKIRADFSVDIPGADLLLGNPYEVLSADVIDAKHIGLGIVNGVECEHLAFRNLDTDWQIWIATGGKPVPCKYVITSKAVTSGPQYTLTITDWKTDAPAADAFALKAGAGGKKVEFKDLSEIDEVPPGVVKGAKK